jgi:signal transduction histidine kinase
VEAVDDGIIVIDQEGRVLFANAIILAQTEVKVGYRARRDEVSIGYQDNGVGVAVDEKERVFEMGHGRGGGLGLHLAREILETSGMYVRENGTPGQGARFEIMVPPDRWLVAATAPGPAGPS